MTDTPEPQQTTGNTEGTINVNGPNYGPNVGINQGTITTTYNIGTPTNVTEIINRPWFMRRLNEVIANAGPRYSPDFHVSLPLAQLFDGLGQTPDFYQHVQVLYSKLNSTYRRAASQRTRETIPGPIQALQEEIAQLVSLLEGIKPGDLGAIAWTEIRESAGRARTKLGACISELQQVVDQSQAIEAERSHPTEEGVQDFGYEVYHFQSVLVALREIEQFTRTAKAQLANSQVLLLVGNAGTGKTHLFCDVAEHRLCLDLPTVLLLGEQFDATEPWAQITRLLDLDCSREEFLDALQAAAQARGAKALLMIDALNEGEGKKIWRKYLRGMLTLLAQYPWIRIALSVRSSYEKTIIPNDLAPNSLIRAEHHGFVDHEYQATRTFFGYFGIAQPSIPLLVPEFQNPLFLKLFCLGLKNRGLTQLPAGLHGVSAIFNFFVDSVNDKLAEMLDYDPHSPLVQRAVDRLAALMAERKTRWLPREEAQTTIHQLLPRDSYEQSLFRHLIAEGLLAEDQRLVGEDDGDLVVYFAYERFSDHLIAKHLLDTYFDPDAPNSSFLSDSPLRTFIEDEQTCWRNQGLVEAFSIQIPERIGQELVDVAPHCRTFYPVCLAFIDSLIWRAPTTIGATTRTYINAVVIQSRETSYRFLNALMIVAVQPEHPYNARFLHQYLMKFALADRDAWWSTFLHEQNDTQSAVDRLIDWGWSSDDKSHIMDDALELSGIALAWLLTTANRFLRDKATKALVQLFTPRIHVLRQVIQQFLDVNDPYILERLFAVAYGCAMRTRNDRALQALALDTYRWVFQDGTPIPHILLRDYARGVIEAAIHKGIELPIAVEKSRPPYTSEWPTAIPIEDELTVYGKYDENMPDAEWARVHLYKSVMGREDFARYIIGIDGNDFAWSARRLGDPREPSLQERYQAFLRSLTLRQQRAWNRYDSVRKTIDAMQYVEPEERHAYFEQDISDEELDACLQYCEQQLRKQLGKKKSVVLDTSVLPYLNQPYHYHDEERLDTSIVQRWILKRVLDLGWSVERFGRFDRARTRGDGREARKAERIGKKYQWIAYHEVLARVSDNFVFLGDGYAKQDQQYEGAWQLAVRDIDPSVVIARTNREDWHAHTNTWWFPARYDAWDTEADDVKWLQSTTDMPMIEQLIEVTSPADGSRWLNLESSYRWEQPMPPGEDRFEVQRRSIWYMLRSYIVKKEDLDELFAWVAQQDFRGRWMPESHPTHNIFLGEFFWSPAFAYHDSPSFHHEGWTRGRNERVPKEILVATDQYVHESSGFDCSIENDIHIYLPCKWIVERMDLQWNGVEGYFFDPQNRMVAFDPSIRTPGPGALLIQRDTFLKFLDDQGYAIIWTILGEKNVVGGLAHQNWQGRLDLSGVYMIQDHELRGVVHATFRSQGK